MKGWLRNENLLLSARHVNKTTRDTELIAVTLVRYKETVGKAIEFFESGDNKLIDIDYERELTKRTISNNDVQKLQIQLEMLRLQQGGRELSRVAAPSRSPTSDVQVRVNDIVQPQQDVQQSGSASLQIFVNNHLHLDRDKRDPRYHHKATALYYHYVTTIPSGHQALCSNEFFKKTKILLKDNYKNAGSKRDRRYEGIELA